MNRSAVGMATLALLIAGCGGHDKAGGRTTAKTGATIPIVVSNTSVGALENYAASVKRLAGGKTKVVLRTGSHDDNSDPDGATIADVRAGRVPFALVSARTLDTLGVTSFTPLLAPFAIDSLGAEQRVLAAGIGDRALPALKRLGVVGVAALPGDMRHPVGLQHPLLRPADFKGAFIGVRTSALSARAFARLGASTDTIAGHDYSGIDGTEADLFDLYGDQPYLQSGAFVAADVSLWPRIYVLVANPKAWAALDQHRRAALSAAARDSLPASIAALRRDDAEAYDDLCRGTKVALVKGTPGDTAALRAALAPLAGDGSVARQVAQARAAAGPPGAFPECRPPARADAGAATPIDGAWTFTSTADDLRASGAPADEVVPENWGHELFAFSRGHFAFSQQGPGSCTWAYGTFSVQGRRMTWDVTDGGGDAPTGAANKPGEHFVFGWSRFKDVLQVTAVRGSISPPNFRTLAWHRTGDDPRQAMLASRCPPPPVGLQF